MSNPFEECKCKPQYSILPHGNDYALFYARCAHHHGYNLAHLVELAFNFEPTHIELLLNAGAAQYAKNPNRGHLAE